LLAGFNPHATVGVLVRSLTRGETLYSREAERSFNPASNQKLLTSAAALALLGAEYRFQTEVLALGLPHGENGLRGEKPPDRQPDQNRARRAEGIEQIAKIGDDQFRGQFEPGAERALGLAAEIIAQRTEAWARSAGATTSSHASVLPVSALTKTKLGAPARVGGLYR